MKKISRVLLGLAVLALTTGCVTSRGFAPGAGERILDTTLKGAIVGTVVGAGVGVLSEVFNGGDQYHRGAVVAPGHGGWSNGGYGYDSRGCRGCSYEYQRQYNAGLAAGESARRYERFQWQEERRRIEAIRAERAGAWGRMDGYEDARYRHR